MAVLGAAKGASMDDVDGRVATWWRPAEPCTSRSFAAACSAGGSGGMARLEAAWGTLELRDERRSNVAMGPSACGCMRMVAVLLLGHQSPWMRPQEHSPSLWRSVPLRWASWSTLGAKRCPFSGLGDRTPYAPRRRGGPTSGGVPFRIIKSFFRAVFCGIPSSIGVAPTWEPSKPCVIG